MKAEYKRDLQNNYLILEVPDEDMEDNYGLRMAERNQVRGLLPIYESRQDGKLYLHYEITSKQTLESMYEKKVMGYQDILYVLAGIRDTLEDMRKYLLSPKQLLFAPEMIYVLPKRGGLMLCYYAKEDEYPITVLAEFILKKLDHKDRQAVTLGYGFFQQASSANFSLPKTLGDIFAVSGAEGRMAEARVTGTVAETQLTGNGSVGGIRLAEDGNMTGECLMTGNSSLGMLTGNGNMAGVLPSWGSAARSMRAEGVTGADVSMSRTAKEREGMTDPALAGWTAGNEDDLKTAQAWAGASGKMGRKSVRGAATMHEEYGAAVNDGEREGIFDREIEFYGGDPPVIHRERKGKKDPEESLADRVFSKVHPAVLLTFLILMVLLELLIAFDVLGLTEAGGCFFLVLSAELLINRRILKKKETVREDWQENEDDEEYQRILREMYQNDTEEELKPIEETRCLVPDEGNEELILVHAPHGGVQESYPDICPGEETLYIGKIQGEADVLLPSATVSRMHARLTVCDGKCLLKDMNSKNGCFVNGHRLPPHGECELQEGDTVAFAEIEYRVVKRC